MKCTSVELKANGVIIKRSGGDPEEWICLSFAEVRAAAGVLREHLLVLTPPEIPPEPEPTGPLISLSLTCAGCGKPIESAREAWKRTRVDPYTGLKEYLPGSYHRDCENP